MKKIILFISLLFIPFIVKASNVEISTVKLIDKSDDTIVYSEPSYEGLKVDFNIGFAKVNDFIEYEVTIKNNDKEDYILTDETKFNNGEYIEYKTSISNGNNVIKKGDTKTVSIIITYKKEIPITEFKEDGTFIENNKYTIDFGNGEVNPDTKTKISIFIILIVLLSLSITIIALTKKKQLLLLIIPLLLTPFIVNGLNKIVFIANTKITIEDKPYILRTSMSSFSTEKDLKEIKVKFEDFDTYTYTRFGNMSSDKPNTPNELVFGINKNFVNDQSYVRIYDKNTNELIKEVTIKDMEKGLLVVNEGIIINNNTYYYELPNYEKENLRVEVSEDILAIAESYQLQPYTLMYGTLGGKIVEIINGPFNTNTEVIDAAVTLRTLTPTGYCLRGFNKNEDNPRIYDAIWSTICPTSTIAG